MKTTIFCMIFLSVLCYSQWQADIRITNSPLDSYTSANNAWCVAANGNDVHVVWFDARDGNREIYYKRSTNSGAGWSSDVRLTNNPASSEVPSVIISGQILLIVWQDNRDGNFEIYCKRSSDGGLSWGAETRLTNNLQTSEFPSASASGQYIFITWHDERDTNFEIYGKRSTDGGLTWSADIRLTNHSYVSQFPCVSVLGQAVNIVWRDNRDGNDEIYFKKSSDGGNTWNTDIRLTNSAAISDAPCVVFNSSAVHVVWEDARFGGMEIYHIRSTDGGLSWGAESRLTNNSSISILPSLAVSGSALHIAWQENRDGNYEIYYKNSTNGGINWSPDTRLTNNSANSESPFAAVSGQVVHIVWYDLRDGNNEIYYKRSTDGGLNWGTDTRLTNNIHYSAFPSVAVSGTIVHVLWVDSRDADYEIYYKLDPTGNPVGLKNINSEIPKEFSLSQNHPNPFNPSTKIQFSLPTTSQEIKLVVYDILCRKVSTLIYEQLRPGIYEIEFDGSKYASGIYFYMLHSERNIQTRKMILIK